MQGVAIDALRWVSTALKSRDAIGEDVADVPGLGLLPSRRIEGYGVVVSVFWVVGHPPIKEGVRLWFWGRGGHPVKEGAGSGVGGEAWRGEVGVPYFLKRTEPRLEVVDRGVDPLCPLVDVLFDGEGICLMVEFRVLKRGGKVPIVLLVTSCELTESVTFAIFCS